MKSSVAEKSVKIRTKHRGVSLEKSQERGFYTIMIPFIIFFIVVKGFPFLWGAYVSMTNFTGFNLSKLKFVGLSNFQRVFSDNEAMASIVRSAKIALFNVPLTMVTCIFLSLLLNQNYKSVGLFRALWYLPSVVPAVATALIWKGIYIYDGGLFNMVRASFGLAPVNWLGYEYVFRSLVIMHLWHCGGGILTNIAAMKQIPDDLYEVADIEGAGMFTKTFKITIPMISNMLYMNLITSTITALQVFGEPVLLAGVNVGGHTAGLTAIPIKPVYTYLVHVYQQIFVNMRFGYGLAMVWVIFALIMILTFIMNVTKKFWVYNEVD